MQIDIEKLREDLIQEVGPATKSGFEIAFGALGDIDSASPYELINLAKMFGIDIRDYVVDDDLER